MTEYKTPLIEKEDEIQIDILQQHYININKGLNELEKINALSEADLSYSFEDYKQIKDELNTLFKNTIEIYTNLKSKKVDSNIIKKKLNIVFSVVDKQKLITKKDDFNKLTNNLDKRFSYFTSKLTNDGKKNYPGLDEDPLGNKIVIKEFEKNNEFVQQRTKDLETVKIISSQVADISSAIKMETFNQGEKLNEVENNVVKSNVNLVKANKEMIETEIITRKSGKKIIILGIFVLALFALIGYGIWKLVKK